MQVRDTQSRPWLQRGTIVLLAAELHLLRRLWMVAMGVRVSKPRDRSNCRLHRLSTMATLYPLALKCSAVAQPQ